MIQDSSLCIQTSRCQFDSANVQGIKSDFETVVSFAQKILNRNFHIIEENLTRRRRTDSQFVFFLPESHTLRIFQF
ncbi:hypothetical protein D3C72_2345800 [compost metagenome]